MEKNKIGWGWKIVGLCISMGIVGGVGYLVINLPYPNIAIAGVVCIFVAVVMLYILLDKKNGSKEKHDQR